MRRRTIGGECRISSGDHCRAEADLAALVVGDRGQQPNAAVFLRDAAKQQQVATALDRRENLAAEILDRERRHHVGGDRDRIAGANERGHGCPASTAAALEIASDSGSGIQMPNSSSNAVATTTIGAANAPSRAPRSCSPAVPNAMSIKCRNAAMNTTPPAARNTTSVSQAPVPITARSN